MTTERPPLVPRHRSLDQAAAIAAATTLLRFAGVDPAKDDSTRDTPYRMAKALLEMTRGYEDDPAQILARQFDGPPDQMIVVRGIRFTSLCEHHVLPFIGTCVVGYLPGSRVVGLSKIPRVVECFARRLQMQERLGENIADAIVEHLDPRGVGVWIEASHSCMCARGVGQADATMVTTDLRGSFRDDGVVRAEFLAAARVGPRG